MGIQDRDYHREQYDKVSASRRTAKTSTAGVALFWITVLVGVLAIVRLLPMLNVPAPVVTPPKVVSTPAPPITPSNPSTASYATVRRPAPVESGHRPGTTPATIYRCGNSYNDEPCAGGRVVDTSVASGFDSRPSERLARQVAEGRSIDIGNVTTINRTVTTTTVNGTVVSSSDTVDRNAICAQLANEIVGIDRAALRPQSASSQDLLRQRPMEVRDQRLRLRC